VTESSAYWFPPSVEHHGRKYDFDLIGGTGEPIYKHVSERGTVRHVIAIYPEIAAATAQNKRVA
jgi:hypothetical protein